MSDTPDKKPLTPAQEIAAIRRSMVDMLTPQEIAELRRKAKERSVYYQKSGDLSDYGLDHHATTRLENHPDVLQTSGHCNKPW
jgi:hypothetical protein